jgi:tetratricopeptide (TPR) repeat protein
MAKILFIFSLILLNGCSPGVYRQGSDMVNRGEYDRAADLYYEEIRNNPESADAWRELGIALYKKGDLTKAEDAFKQANNIKPQAGSNMYLGLIYEKQEKYDLALEAYRVSLSLKPKGSSKEMITARLDYLISKKIELEVSQALNKEADIRVDTIPENSIAVFDFDNSQLPSDLAPISKGLAEMTAIDLSKVESLKVVDRLKIDAILGELKLSSTKYADAEVGPRLGRLMGSNRIVSGVITGIGDEQVRLDGAIVSTATSATSTTDATQGELEKFFQIQKDFVFKVIDSLGIELSVEERDAIEKVPTESFLAFLAYSKGLDFRSRGMYQEAAGEFNNAVQLDGNFAAARQQMNSTQNLLSSGAGSLEQLEVSAATSSDEGSGTVESFQSSLLSGSSFIDEGFSSDRFGRPDLPPRPTPIYNVGTVIIRGNIDAQP